jgi:hypothetical protein
LAVEKRYNVNVHTGKPLQSEPKKNEIQNPESPGTRRPQILVQTKQERPVSPKRKFARTIFLSEFAAREERVRVQRIYNPHKNPYQHETIGRDREEKNFLGQIIEANEVIDKFLTKPITNTDSKEFILTAEELYSVDCW